MAHESEHAEILVEVAYATPARQSLLKLAVPAGTTVAEAIERSAIREEFPEIAEQPEAVGIFGRKVALEQPLRDGDRVEIYRPLLADPKEKRKERARQRAEG